MPLASCCRRSSSPGVAFRGSIPERYGRRIVLMIGVSMLPTLRGVRYDSKSETYWLRRSFSTVFGSMFRIMCVDRQRCGGPSGHFNCPWAAVGFGIGIGHLSTPCGWMADHFGAGGFLRLAAIGRSPFSRHSVIPGNAARREADDDAVAQRGHPTRDERDIAAEESRPPDGKCHPETTGARRA